MDARNQLAEQRTLLANQRTFLAFVRTAIMICASGITFIKVFPDDKSLVVLGYVFLPVSVVTFVTGMVLYFRENRKIKKMTDC
jgi:putative membrane protein